MTDETPTPRQTGRWDFWAEAARQTAQQLRNVELRATGRIGDPGYDRPLGDLARHARMVALDFVAAFERWEIRRGWPEVTIEQRSLDRKRFEKFLSFSSELIATAMKGPA